MQPKRLEGHLIAVGRLAPSKRYDHAIDAIVILRRTYHAATLMIVGDVRAQLWSTKCFGDRGGGRGRSTGAVDEDEKVRLLTESDILVGCSAREGWGLTVTEAAIHGTVSVVYDIPGFIDSVVHERRESHRAHPGGTGRRDCIAPRIGRFVRAPAVLCARDGP